MASPLKQYLDRSLNKLRQDAVKAMKMDIHPSTPPINLYSFTSALPLVEDASFLATGSDIDIGGSSTCNLTLVPALEAGPSLPSELPTPPMSPASPLPSSSTPASSSTLPPSPPITPSSTHPSGPTLTSTSHSHMAFHGNMSLRVPPEYSGRIKAGYAGLRNRKRKTLFGEETWDLSLYSHLRVNVAYRGWEGWRNRWYCNIQTDGPILTDLFQYRLDLPASPASTPSSSPLNPLSPPLPRFTTLHLPLDSFVLTNSGETSEHQMTMLASKIRTIGFSLLGGGRGEDGIPPSVSPPPSDKIAEMRRMAAGGAGKGGEADLDPEAEAMLKSDGVDTSLLGREREEPGRPTGYRRVRSRPATSPLATGRESIENEGVQVTPWSEGYYELCIRSVEAVNYDPMREDAGPEDRD